MVEIWKGDFMSTKNLSPVLKHLFCYWLSWSLLGIVMPWRLPSLVPEQLRKLFQINLAGFTYYWSRQSFYFVAFSWIGRWANPNLGNPIRCLNTLPSLSCHDIFCWMGIGLVFYGAAEPLSLYHFSNLSATPGSQGALADAFRYTFFHWGIHAWAVYALIALALAYFGFRKSIFYRLQQSPCLVKTNGILGKDRRYDYGGHFTVIGVATTLGFGAAKSMGDSTTSLVFQTMCPCASYCHNYHNHPLYHFSPFWSWKGVKSYQATNLILAVGLLAITIIIGPWSDF